MACPLYPRKLPRHPLIGVSAKGQKRTSEAAYPERNKVASQNDLVG
jgi:hypothetical protein